MISQGEITEYYRELDRAFFMGGNKKYAYVDAAFSIGYDQTISQPSLVLRMTIMLEADKDSKVLEIGTGSGYQTALLAKFSSGVYTVERIEPLKDKAVERLSELGFINIKFKLGDGTQGWEEHAPYDRIMVTAAAHKIPEKLIEQLAPGGRMIIPVGRVMQSIFIVTKNHDGEISITKDIPVRFVKLTGKY